MKIWRDTDDCPHCDEYSVGSGFVMLSGEDFDALQERCERLRRALVTLGADAWMDGHKGDLADDLIPRKGDVLP